MKAPFPWFGGKSRVAPLVWPRFGTVANYVEPFFGSGAMLLGRPGEPSTETVNDLDGLVANFWRAIAHDPAAVAAFADNPVFENDLHARHAWLVGQKDGMAARLEGDPGFYDAKVAGWWCWGICSWIGSGFCSGNGPWAVRDRKLVHLGDNGRGINRKLVHLGNGMGINRQLVHLGDNGMGINRQLVHLGNGMGINRQLVHLGNKGHGVNGAGVEKKRPHLMSGKGVHASPGDLTEWFAALSQRLRRVRVCCGDWSRICGPSVTFKHGLTAVFLDPPYSDEAGRTSNLYRKDCGSVAHAVREWALANGDNPLMRIALCGYEGEHAMPKGWDCVAWKAPGGFGSQAKEGNVNGRRERIWFSPHCVAAEQGLLL